jgi:hypothetical protein
MQEQITSVIKPTDAVQPTKEHNAANTANYETYEDEVTTQARRAKEASTIPFQKLNKKIIAKSPTPTPTPTPTTA